MGVPGCGRSAMPRYIVERVTCYYYEVEADSASKAEDQVWHWPESAAKDQLDISIKVVNVEDQI